MFGEYALELRALERLGRNTPRDVEIEVARQDNRGVRFVPRRIVNALIKLGAAQIIITTALKVEIVGCHRSASDAYVAHQSHPATRSLLQRWDVR